MKFLFGLAIAGALLGGLVLVGGLVLSNGAPQEAAVAGVALACAVLPYCLARAAHAISSINSETERWEQQQTQTRLLAAIANDVSRPPLQPSSAQIQPATRYDDA